MSSLRQFTQEVNQANDVAGILTWTDVGCLPVQQVAVTRLLTLCRQNSDNIEKLVASILAHQTAGRINALCAVGQPQFVLTLLPHLLSELRTFSPEIQKSVARLICRTATGRISELISNTTASTARILCFHAIRGELTQEQLYFLKKKLQAFDLPGLQHLLRAVMDLDSACTDQDASFHDLQSIVRWIFSLQLDVTRSSTRLSDGRPLNALSIDFESDAALLISAVRHAEREELRSREIPEPWSFCGVRDELDGLCQFINLPSDQFLLYSFQQPIQEARRLGVPPELRVPFILEAVASQLLCEDERWEAETFRIARWRTMSLHRDWSPDQFKVNISQNAQRRLPEALGLITHKIKSKQQTQLAPSAIRNARIGVQSIAPCTAAAIHIWRTINPDKAKEKETMLLDAEPFGARHLTPIGIEIQIPRVDRDEYVGWLEFFRSHGIPVPRRPECISLFELAVPPAISWHAPAEILNAVSTLQVAQHSQDVAIHVSLQGDLGVAGGVLAFTQLFLNTSTVKQPRSLPALRHVMSKGLVHRNQDVIACKWAIPSSCRTELRVVILPIFESFNPETEVDNVTRTLRELQLLGSASLSEVPADRQFFSEFQQDLESLVTSYPNCLKELLDADFYESTGDYRALSLLDNVSILKCREQVRLQIQGKLRTQFTNELRSLRSRHAERLEEHWKCDL